MVRGNHQRLLQVFVNLFNNAMQASLAGDRILVRGASRQRRAEVTVEDEGEGIAAPPRPHLRTLFHHQPVGEGTGLGLSVVYSIVEDHGGQVNVENLPRAGPVSPCACPCMNRRASNEANIHIVDDEPVIRHALHRLLEREGYRVAEATSLAEARSMCTGKPFDLAICDLRLPDGEGIDLAGACPDTPVLIMTSYASVRSAVEAMKTGAVDYIAKPFDHDEMLLIVARILKQRSLERENETLRSRPARVYPLEGMVGRNSAMAKVCDTVQKVAPTDTTVLIRGESGTGKELVARALHAKSPRAAIPLISVNCASIPEGCSSRSCSATRRARSPARRRAIRA
jgi:ActR/RegA family two-component response regulator